MIVTYYVLKNISSNELGGAGTKYPEKFISLILNFYLFIHMHIYLLHYYTWFIVFISLILNFYLFIHVHISATLL